MIIESCIKERVELSETHMKRMCEAECGTEGEDSPWEGMVGGAVWTGQERNLEGVAILML